LKNIQGQILSAHNIDQHDKQLDKVKSQTIIVKENSNKVKKKDVCRRKLEFEASNG
jgi:hypothetical protein